MGQPKSEQPLADKSALMTRPHDEQTPITTRDMITLDEYIVMQLGLLADGRERMGREEDALYIRFVAKFIQKDNKLRQLERELQAEHERGRRVRKVVDAAIEFETYLARVNTQERQSIVFSVPDDDTDGVAMAGFCERLSKLSHAIRAISRTESAPNGMSIYIICPVRNADQKRTHEMRAYAERLRQAGHDVHFPPDDVPRDDPTGESICIAHRDAMLRAHEVHVFWDVESKGSHFDLGMAYALGLKIVPVACERPDETGKSYWKVINLI